MNLSTLCAFRHWLVSNNVDLISVFSTLRYLTILHKQNYLLSSL